MTTWDNVLHHLQNDLVAQGNALLDRLPAIVVAIVVLAIAGGIARMVHRSARLVAANTGQRTSLGLLIERFTVIGIWFVGTLVAALLVFPGLRIGDIVATLGLSTVAVGFAFADIFKNFLAGILLLFSEPFRIGDLVRIGDYEGTVEHIDVRSTRIRTSEGERVLLPNALVFGSPVQVRTAFSTRRNEIVVRVAYGSDLSLARTAILGASATVADVCPEPPPRVDASEFAENAVLLSLRYWTESTGVDVLRVRGEAVLAVESALEEAGIAIPPTSRVLHVAERTSAAEQAG